MCAKRFMQVYESKYLEGWWQFGFGCGNESYLLLCYVFSASWGDCSWWSQQFSQSVAKGGSKTESNLMIMLWEYITKNNIYFFPKFFLKNQDVYGACNDMNIVPSSSRDLCMIRCKCNQALQFFLKLLFWPAKHIFFGNNKSTENSYRSIHFLMGPWSWKCALLADVY